MRSKNSRPLTAAERAHLARVKELPCVICLRGGPSEAHHIVQGLHFAVISVCADCHRGPIGWHGDKTLWRIRKMDELKALNVTLGRLAA